MSAAFDRFLTRVRDLLGASRTSGPAPKGGSRTQRPPSHPPHGTSTRTSAGTSAGTIAGTGTGTTGYPGDASALPTMSYAPRPDGRPDPGEIVWTWVPYEEDNSQGKDRPVLVIGREGDWLVALQLTSKDHDRDEEQERRSGRIWVDIGAGQWDRAGRPSEVRVNRLIRVDPDAVRREGAVLPRERYDVVVAAVRSHYA